MLNREWAVERVSELIPIRKDNLEADVECVDLQGALMRMKRTTDASGAWHSAQRRLHDWRYHRDAMAESRLSNPGLMKLYAQLRS